MKNGQNMLQLLNGYMQLMTCWRITAIKTILKFSNFKFINSSKSIASGLIFGSIMAHKKTRFMNKVQSIVYLCSIFSIFFGMILMCARFAYVYNIVGIILFLVGILSKLLNSYIDKKHKQKGEQND